MLNLILGADWVSNRDAILQMIAKDVADKKENRILMVPELISHDTERRLCAAAGDTSSRYAEVLSFTRLMHRVSDYVGCLKTDCLDDGGRIVAIASAVQQIHSKLKAYASVMSNPEFLTSLLDMIDEFKRCCILPDDLMFASKNTEGVLAQKLEELSLLYSTYDCVCESGKRDPRDQMTLLLEQLEDCSFCEDHVFYIDGFPDFTRQHMAIIEYIISTSAQVYISLNCDRPDSVNPAFENAADTAMALIRYADRANIQYSITYIEPTRKKFDYLLNNVFHGKITPSIYGNELTVYQTQSIYQECVAAAEKILKLVREGARYKDISIVCSDIAMYRDVINLIFHRCRIPLYISGTESVLDKPAVSTVLAAVDAALGGFEQSEVLRYLRSSLSPLTMDQCDQIENYAILWSIKGADWLRQWVNHPSGLGAEFDEQAQEKLRILNEQKTLALEPLFSLKESFSNANNLSDQIDALYRFFDDISFSQRLRNLSDEFDEKGDNRNAQILNQLWETMLKALEQMQDVLGRTVWNTESFVRLFKLLLSQYDVGTIPPVLDAVTIGPVNVMRCHQTKHVFVLGALEGSLPKYGSQSGVLSDQDRMLLRGMGLALNGGSIDTLRAEFCEIYGALCAADESIIISCPSGQPSFLFRRMREMAGEEYIPEYSLGAALSDAFEASAFLSRWDKKEFADSLGLRDLYDEVQSHKCYKLGEISQDNINRLYGSSMVFSASQIDKQAVCRLSYFLRYGIHAKEQKAVSIDPAEFGTYVHAVLEMTAKRIMSLGGFKKVGLNEAVQIANDFSRAYAQERFGQLDTTRITYLFERNSRELEMIVQELWQEMQQSEFIPIDFEVEFGGHGKLPGVRLPSEKFDAQLRGFVDRVDVWNDHGTNYFRVVDYKTGKKDFDYCDIFNGLGLQMLIYLFALQEQGKELLGDAPVPAGVQYFPARVPVISSDGTLSDEEIDVERIKQWKRKGLLLMEEDVLHAMETVEDPKRLSFSRKKDGTLAGDLADRKQFAKLKKYLYMLLEKMIADIASGCVDPNPYTRGTSYNCCTFCPYDSICHSQFVEGRRNYKTMSAQRFWDDIDEELRKNV